MVYQIYGLYRKVRNASWKVLLDHKICTLPVNVTQIARNHDIAILKNSMANALEPDESGRSLFVENQWYIVYDDMEKSQGYKRFTIAHELGHIFLGHPDRFDSPAGMTEDSRPRAEKDADSFAARLLAPACVLWGLDLHTADDIEKNCCMSMDAARIRAQRMKILYERNKFLSDPLEQRLFQQFEPYIQENQKPKEV